MLQGTTNFQISWLSSFALFALFICAPAAGVLSDKYGPTVPMAVGSVVQLVAVFMISLCRTYWQFFLAQGLLLAVGMSFVAIPASGMVPRYFKRHRGVASGISVAGSSLGGVVWPLVMGQLLYKHELSFAWSIRVVGFIMIPLLALVVLLVRPPPQPPAAQATGEEKDSNTAADAKKAARKRHRADLRKPPFLLLCAGLFFYYLAFFSPYLFVATYATTHLGMSTNLAFYLVSIVNAASLFGRILPGFIADRVGKFNVLIVSSAAASLVAFCWTAATTVAGVVVWIAAYGFASGVSLPSSPSHSRALYAPSETDRAFSRQAILSLQLACGTSLVHESIASTAIGVAMGSTSISGLFGAPIGGQLSERGYLSLAMFTGAMMLAGTVLVVCSRVSQERRFWAVV